MPVPDPHRSDLEWRIDRDSHEPMVRVRSWGGHLSGFHPIDRFNRLTLLLKHYGEPIGVTPEREAAWVHAFLLWED